MKKRRVRYPATVAFRTTNEIKDLLETTAIYENKTVSEVLQAIVYKGLITDFPSVYFFLVSWLASIRGKDFKWIKEKIDTHLNFMKYDTHHGYNEKVAIEDIKYEIEICLELAKGKRSCKRDFNNFSM